VRDRTTRAVTVEQLHALLLDARGCLADDVRAAGELQARLQPGIRFRAQLVRRIDRAIKRTRRRRRR
jgi:hypothetical protein